MKKKVAQQIEELSVQERKVIFRAGMIYGMMSWILILISAIILISSMVNMLDARRECENTWGAYRAERDTKGYSLSILTDYDVTLDDIELAEKQRVEAVHKYLLDSLVCILAMLFFMISSEIYMRKMIPQFTMRRLRYLSRRSKARRKELLAE